MSSAKENDKDYPQKILEAAKSITPHVYKTPLMFSSYLSKMGTDSNVYVKLGKYTIDTCSWLTT